jgi:hypothetical protein
MKRLLEYRRIPTKKIERQRRALHAARKSAFETALAKQLEEQEKEQAEARKQEERDKKERKEVRSLVRQCVKCIDREVANCRDRVTVCIEYKRQRAKYWAYFVGRLRKLGYRVDKTVTSDHRKYIPCSRVYIYRGEVIWDRPSDIYPIVRRGPVKGGMIDYCWNDLRAYSGDKREAVNFFSYTIVV